MSLADLLVTLPGRYLVESVCHSLTAAVVVEGAVRAWAIRQPVVQQRLRTLVIFLPVFTFPAYHLVDRHRGAMSSRLHALLNSDGWLYLEPCRGLPLYAVFFLLLVLTAVVFLVQELVPIIRHLRGSGKAGYRRLTPMDETAMAATLQGIPGKKPDIALLDIDDPLIFSATGSDATIYVSRGLREVLTSGQLQAAIAHELAHIRRSQSSTLVVLFLLRIAMFFNPVALIEFRRIVHAEEDICDDVAISWTNKPEDLAAALERLFEGGAAPTTFHVERISDLRSALEEHSHKLHIAERIARLRDVQSDREEGWPVVFAIAALVIVAMNYYVL
ncbi:MAG: M56 family metallopeptidase [Nitrospirota bacterium]|jgi:Zn-dependent protease with chaperone function